MHDEGVAQVVHARSVVGAAVAPAELGSEAREHPIDLVGTQLLAPSAASRAHKERTVLRRGDPAVTQPPVPSQRLDRARVQRHVA